MVKRLFLFVFLLFASDAIAQDTLSNVELNEHLAEYTEDIVSRRDSLAKTLTGFFEVLVEEETLTKSEEVIIQDVLDSLILKLQAKTRIQELKELKSEAFIESGFLYHFGKLEAQIIWTNIRLRDLISKDVIAKEPPYAVNEEYTSFKRSINFLNIQNGEAILDVGAGRGTLSFLLSHIYDDLIIGINEKKKRLLKFIDYEVKLNKSDRPSNTIKTFRGTRRKTGADGQYYDKVIMVNTLHHLSHKKKMLKSIGNHLPKGDLYIIDQIRGENTCKKAMTYEEILDILQQCDYSISAEKRHENMIFLKCMPAK